MDLKILKKLDYWKDDIFKSIEEVDDRIRTICFHLKEDPHPVFTLMTCQQSRFFLPVFCSLKQCIDPDSFPNCFRALKRILLLDNCTTTNDSIQFFLHCFAENINNERLVIERLSRHFTFNTIVYCGMIHGFVKSFLAYEELRVFQTQHLLETMKEHLAACSTVSDAINIVVWIVNIVFPSSISEKNEIHLWDPFAEAWCMTQNIEKCYLDIYRFVWEVMKDFMFREFCDWRRDLWLQFDEPEWERYAEEADGGFILYDDYSPQRYKDVLKQMFFEGYESANVPEYYLFEKTNFQLIPNF